MTHVALTLDRDDAAVLAPILRGRLEDIERNTRLRADVLTDFDKKADERYAQRIRACLTSIEMQLPAGRTA